MSYEKQGNAPKLIDSCKKKKNYKSQLEATPTRQIWDNLSIKMNKNRNELQLTE